MDDDHRPRLRRHSLRPDPPVNPLVARYGEKLLTLIVFAIIGLLLIAMVGLGVEIAKFLGTLVG